MKMLWIGAAAFLCWQLQVFFYQKFWNRGLSAGVQFLQKAVREGGQGELREVVENRKFLPLPVLHVNIQVDRSLHFLTQGNVSVTDQTYRRDIFAILPYQRITRTLSFIGTRRGYYQSRRVELVGRDLFLVGPYVEKQQTDAELYVYPKAIPMEPVKTACQEMLGEYWWKKKLFEDPFAFCGIRDYESSDSFRQVNWKACGRTGQLKVNVYENTAMAQASVFLNVKGEDIWTEELLPESVIRIGGALAEQWLALGIPVGIWTNGRDVQNGGPVKVMPGAGPDHGTTILQALSRIQWREAEDSLEWGRMEAEAAGSSLVVYVSCRRDETDLRNLEWLRQSGAETLWICPYTERQEAQRQVDTVLADRRLREEGPGFSGRGFAGEGPDCSGGSVGGEGPFGPYGGPVKRWRAEE